MKGLGFYGEEFFTVKEDNDLIRENISRILLTTTGERVMSNFGSPLKGFLFAPETALQEEVNGAIKKAITRWEPRVEVVAVEAVMESAEKASIVLKVVNKETLEPFTYEAIIRL